MLKRGNAEIERADSGKAETRKTEMLKHLSCSQKNELGHCRASIQPKPVVRFPSPSAFEMGHHLRP